MLGEQEREGGEGEGEGREGGGKREVPTSDKRKNGHPCGKCLVVVVVSDACLDVRCVCPQRHGGATTVAETNWWQVTWESRLPTTSRVKHGKNSSHAILNQGHIPVGCKG